MKRRNMFCPRLRNSLTWSVTMGARSCLNPGQFSAAHASEGARRPVQSSGSLTTRADDINGRTQSVHVPVLDSWTIVSGSRSVHVYRTDTRVGRRNAISVLSVTVTKVCECTCTAIVHLRRLVGLDYSSIFSLTETATRRSYGRIFSSGEKRITITVRTAFVDSLITIHKCIQWHIFNFYQGSSLAIIIQIKTEINRNLLFRH